MGVTWNYRKERVGLETSVQSGTLDFPGRYMAAAELHRFVRKRPELAAMETVRAMKSVLKEGGITRNRQCLALYREAAQTLRTVILLRPGESLALQAMSVLRGTLASISGYAHQAAAEALGALPLEIEGPGETNDHAGPPPSVSWAALARRLSVDETAPGVLLGRSLVTEDGAGGLAVVKFARTEDDAKNLRREVGWMRFLGGEACSFPMRFDVPVPKSFQGKAVFLLRDLPCPSPFPRDLRQAGHLAICFSAHREYFAYPNQPDPAGALPSETFIEVMGRNAWLLGRLTSLGIVHTALIPLFHNRVQGDRRADRGVYDWSMGGRLDRWLESCAHPNFSLTGLRDFEHMHALKSSGLTLYRHMGAHFLSLLLVAASYFRNRDPARRGFDLEGHPKDCRDLFDPETLRTAITKIFLAYYEGFAGEAFPGALPLDPSALAARMIEEMGVDRHMEEVLRQRDQVPMTDGEFSRFLEECGHPPERAASFIRGEADIVLRTGPHLGGFNDVISLPELIEAAATMSGLCAAGRFEARARSG